MTSTPQIKPTPSSTTQISIEGANEHNLKNVDVSIPHNALVAMTGVSGSGKSSLAFDTLFAEGQRRYLESLSTYTRQFLNQLGRPDVLRISGLPPVITVDQRTGSTAPRSTLATMTEIHDYLRVLYARAGNAHCPTCKTPVESQTSQQIVRQILALADKQKVMILAPFVRGRKGMHRAVFTDICSEGLVRARVDGEIVDSADPPELSKSKQHDIEAVVDRIVVKPGIESRVQESIDLALRLGDGVCLVTHQIESEWHDRLYSQHFACPQCETSYPPLETRSFSFNSPYGACPECDGLGHKLDDNDDSSNDDAIPCPACDGGRLNPFSQAVTLFDRSLPAVSRFSVSEAHQFFQNIAIDSDQQDLQLPLSVEKQEVVRKAVPQLLSKLEYLLKVGLGYLSLGRGAKSLSGGEFQRARLAGCLGSGLVGVCYILDEPTIGLHPHDTGQLIRILQQLRDSGNTVIVVEHDLDVVGQSDQVIDLGPGAGDDGGMIVAQGTPAELTESPTSVTGPYLKPATPTNSTQSSKRQTQEAPRLKIVDAIKHNLKNVTVEIPLQVLTAVSGVSGSGKSTLIHGTLVPSLKSHINHSESQFVGCKQIQGVEHIDRVIEIDQSALGKSGRSNPATYTGLWNEVRKLFAHTRDARIRGFTARRFSFNSKQGGCPACSGKGTQRIEMHFMPDMYVRCPECNGQRFNRQTLSIRFSGHSVADVLDMRIDHAAELFSNFPKLKAILDTLTQIGLGYLALGQPSYTLSGGEAQRIKLATELSKATIANTLFVLDEPTTGLHPHDVGNLLGILQGLVDKGNSVLVIEHNLDVLAAADWLIDLGPKGGNDGGKIVFTGPPEDAIRCQESLTGKALKSIINGV